MARAQRPPHPGQRPPPYSFPDQDARRAADEARELAEALRTMASRLDADTQDLARGGFSGVFATWVFDHVGTRRESLEAMARQLDDQADQIDQLRLRADHAHEARNVEIARHDAAYARWRDWRPPVGVR